MVHIIASFAFSLIALGASLVVFQTLAEGRTKILHALGLIEAAPSLTSPRPVRVRRAGHWRAMPASPSRQRAVA